VAKVATKKGWWKINPFQTQYQVGKLWREGDGSWRTRGHWSPSQSCHHQVDY